jgi:hypothetical protein
LESSEKGYRKILNALIDARRTGQFSYEAMVDGLREAQRTTTWKDIADRARSARYIHLDPWQNQLVIPEIVLEKDAILRLIEDECTAQDVTIRTFRGDPSLSFLYSTAQDYAALLTAGNWVSVGYLGDHDPSGLNIGRAAERGIREILKNQFSIDLDAKKYKHAFEWKRLGVNFSDFKQFNLLPIPTKDGSNGKKADTKRSAYIGEFGISYGCELDALPLDEITRRVHNHIEGAKSQELWEKTKSEHAEEEARWLEMMGGIV